MSPTSLARTALALLLLAALQDPGWELAPPRTVDEDVPVRLDDLSDLDCARCHRAVTEEWATTLHAYAWQDPFYREELEDRRKPQACHGCHIPQPVHLSGLEEKPVARTEALHLGVSCQACHRGPEQTILGPRGTPTDAHASRRADTFVGAGTNRLCASCHGTFVGPVIGLARDFEQGELAAGGATCVGCHMAPVERSWANAPEGEAGGEDAPRRAGRSHALQTPRDPSFLRRALQLGVAREAGAVVLTIANAAGHRVPGLIGRALELRVELVDAAGVVLAAEEVVIDSEQPLMPGEPWRVELAGDGAALVVRGEHVDPRLIGKVPFLDERLAP